MLTNATKKIISSYFRINRFIEIQHICICNLTNRLLESIYFSFRRSHKYVFTYFYFILKITSFIKMIQDNAIEVNKM